MYLIVRNMLTRENQGNSYYIFDEEVLKGLSSETKAKAKLESKIAKSKYGDLEENS